MLSHFLHLSSSPHQQRLLRNSLVFASTWKPFRLLSPLSNIFLPLLWLPTPMHLWLYCPFSSSRYVCRKEVENFHVHEAFGSFTDTFTSNVHFDSVAVHLAGHHVRRARMESWRRRRTRGGAKRLGSLARRESKRERERNLTAERRPLRRVVGGVVEWNKYEVGVAVARPGRAARHQTSSDPASCSGSSSSSSSTECGGSTRLN